MRWFRPHFLHQIKQGHLKTNMPLFIRNKFSTLIKIWKINFWTDYKINDIMGNWCNKKGQNKQMCLKWLTFHQRGWHRGWRGCCPCPPGSALVRRKSVVCFEWRTAVSPGWCPGGLGSPRTGRWCDRLPADSSLDPCSPRGHLTRSNKRRRCQAHCINLTHWDIIHFDCCLKAWAYSCYTRFILKYL